MNKAKAMLDALMGPNRDVAAKDKTNDDFSKDNSCKFYLAGMCPHAMLGKKLHAMRMNPDGHDVCQGCVYRVSLLNPDGCPQLHSQGLRTQMSEHPESEEYKKKYEKQLHNLIQRAINEVEEKIANEKKKREDCGRAHLAHENEHCWFKTCEICGLTYKLMKRKLDTDARRNIAKLNMLKGGLTKLPGDWYCPGCKDLQFSKNLTCRRCGEANPDPESCQRQALLEVEDLHHETEVHVAYTKLRKKLDELNTKYGPNDGKEPEPERPAPASKPRDRSRSRDRSRGGGRDAGGRGGGNRSREREPRRRSDSRRGRRQRDSRSPRRSDSRGRDGGGRDRYRGDRGRGDRGYDRGGRGDRGYDDRRR